MKLNRPKFPFINDKLGAKFEAEFPFKEEEISDEDVLSGGDFEKDSNLITKLIEQNRIPEVKRIIDKNNLAEELSYPDAGVATRSYIDSLLGKKVLEQNPQFSNMADLDLVNSIKNKFYPQLGKISDIANVSNDVTTNHNDGDHYHIDDGLNIDPNSNIDSNYSRIATIMHELGHQSDAAYPRAIQKKAYPIIGSPNESVINSMNEIDKAAPKYKNLYGVKNPHKDEMTNHEGKITNNVIPNFNDYDWKSGDFNSNYIKNPTDVQDESAKKHHINRNYAFDNLINLIQNKKDKIL